MPVDRAFLVQLVLFDHAPLRFCGPTDKQCSFISAALLGPSEPGEHFTI
jgi:hypothetical protein